MNLPELTWVEPVEIQIPSEFAQSLAEHPVVLNALVRRGITQLDQARAYMDPSFYHLADPLEIPGMDLAVSRIQTALESGEKIAIWGDFDVDGQTSTSLLAHTFKLLGANFQQYIPVRARESHGVNTSGLDRLIKAGATLILTCDTGITAHAEVEYAHLHGVDSIITDHHTLPASLPDAKAVVNPQRLPPEHPLRPLCGVGVAYQLAKELLKRSGKENEAVYLLDLVALGTVADLASLTGDNRPLVQSGLQVFRNSPRPAFKALLSLADVNPAQLNEEHLGFVIAPRLNALGRLGDANPIVPFLLSAEGTTVLSLAQELETLNSRRKLLCDQVFQAALARIQRDRAFLDDAVLVLEHANWPAGVIGIVASRLVDLYKRPVILISADPGGVGRASARSIEGINITQALDVNQDLLVNYGGHAMAAGFSL